MNQSPVLSVIIPVYNAKAYLEEAIQSALSQGFDDDQIEIICVDDGSKDGSGELLDEIASKMKNLKVIHQENGGSASARNEGLNHVNGRYFLFMDADDELIPNCMKELTAAMDREEADVCQYQYTRTHEWKEIIETPISCRKEGMQINGFVWLYIFRTSKLISLRFDKKLKYAEDIFYCHQVVLRSPKCIVTDHICYYYRETPGSMMAQRNPEEMAGVMLQLAESLKGLEKDESFQMSDRALRDTRIFYGRAAGYYMAYSLCAGNNDSPFPMLKGKGLWPPVREWRLLKPKKNRNKMLKDSCVFFIQFRPAWWIMQKTKLLYRFRHLLFR